MEKDRSAQRLTSIPWEPVRSVPIYRHQLPPEIQQTATEAMRCFTQHRRGDGQDVDEFYKQTHGGTNMQIHYAESWLHRF